MRLLNVLSCFFLVCLFAESYADVVALQVDNLIDRNPINSFEYIEEKEKEDDNDDEEDDKYEDNSNPDVGFGDDQDNFEDNDRDKHLDFDNQVNSGNSFATNGYELVFENVRPIVYDTISTPESRWKQWKSVVSLTAAQSG